MGIEVGLATIFGALGSLSTTGAAVAGSGLTGVAGTTFTAGNIIGGVSTAASIAGTGASMYGQVQAQKQQASMAEYNIAVEEARQQQLTAEGQERVSRLRSQNQRFLGQQRGAMAKSGIAMDTGSSLEVMADTKAMMELEALDAQYQTQMQLRTSRQKAQAYGMEADSAKKALPLSLAATALGGANQMAKLKLS